MTDHYVAGLEKANRELRAQVKDLQDNIQAALTASALLRRYIQYVHAAHVCYSPVPAEWADAPVTETTTTSPTNGELLW